MYREWYFTEFFSQYAPFKDWVSGEMVKSINVYDAWMLILNLDSSQDAVVTTTFYYEDEAPRDYQFILPAGKQGRLHLQDDVDNLGTKNLPSGCNPFKRFGVRVVSTQPVVVQATMGDRIGNERITNSMATRMFYPGPLGEVEKQWCYIDCLVLESSVYPLEEREWITILNPNPAPAQCTLTFIPGGDVDSQGQVQPAAAGLKPMEYTVTVPPERILPLAMCDIPGVKVNQPYALRVTSDQPVTLQGIRHIFERGKYEFSRCWAVLDAIPVQGNLIRG